MRHPFLCASLLLCACYQYTPVSGPGVVAGEHVRLALTPAATERHRPMLGVNTIAVEGVVRAVSESEVVLAMTASHKSTLPSGRLNWTGEPITLQLSEIAGSERRVLDRKRTTRAAVLGTVGALVVLRLMVSGGAFGGSDPGEPPVTPP